MPIELLYLALVFVVAIIGFSVLKRPLYECMLAAFVVLLAVSGTWAQAWDFIWDALTEPTLYVIIVCVVSAGLLSKTAVIDDCINIILSVFGRLPGGAGFVALIGSTYMGSLSGSGPGNVATTGVFTIPAMKKSGFPPHLAANVEAHASTMGNMIPPAAMIGIAFKHLEDYLAKNDLPEFTLSQFWMVLWVIALWFIIQRIVTMMLMCRYYKVKPMAKQELPSLWKSLKHGWKAVFLPLIVFLPFFLTNLFEEPLAAHLVDGAAKAFNNSILWYLPALIVIAGLFLSSRASRKQMTVPFIYKTIRKGMASLVPTSALVLFAYFISNAFEFIEVEKAVANVLSTMNLPLWGLALILPLFTAVLGCLIPGSTQVKIFGGIIIGAIAAASGNPIIAAAMLPCICGAMHGVTPPYCTCVYIAMGIAEADLKPTIANNMIWIGIHYIMSVLMLLGMIPLFGLVG